MKALEDLCSNYDVTVRNSAGTLIQVTVFFKGQLHVDLFVSLCMVRMVSTLSAWRRVANQLHSITCSSILSRQSQTKRAQACCRTRQVVHLGIKSSSDCLDRWSSCAERLLKVQSTQLSDGIDRQSKMTTSSSPRSLIWCQKRLGIAQVSNTHLHHRPEN